jgi:sRNA-binding protein
MDTNGHREPNPAPIGKINPEGQRGGQIDVERLAELERQLAEAQRRIDESRAKLDRLLAKRGVAA